MTASTIVGIYLAVLQQFSGVNAINVYCNPIIARVTTSN